MSVAKRKRRLRVIQDRPTKFPKGETFRACATGRSGNYATECFEPASTIAAAMDRGRAACAAGKSVKVRGQYTSDGTKWKNHGGRTVASCDGNKRWQLG